MYFSWRKYAVCSMHDAAALLKQTQRNICKRWPCSVFWYGQEIKERVLRQDYLEMAVKSFQHQDGITRQQRNSTTAKTHFPCNNLTCKMPRKIAGPSRLRTPGNEKGKTWIWRIESRLKIEIVCVVYVLPLPALRFLSFGHFWRLNLSSFDVKNDINNDILNDTWKQIKLDSHSSALRFTNSIHSFRWLHRGSWQETKKKEAFYFSKGTPGSSNVWCFLAATGWQIRRNNSSY